MLDNVSFYFKLLLTNLQQKAAVVTLYHLAEIYSSVQENIWLKCD